MESDARGPDAIHHGLKGKAALAMDNLLAQKADQDEVIKGLQQKASKSEMEMSIRHI
jgi:hypothetical protein